VTAKLKLHLPRSGQNPRSIEFDASEVLSVRTGTEIHIRRKNARVINLFVEQIELDLRGRTFGREGEAAFDILRQDSGITAQSDIAVGLSMFASERRKVFDRRCRFLRISRLYGRPGQRRPQNARPQHRSTAQLLRTPRRFVGRSG